MATKKDGSHRASTTGGPGKRNVDQATWRKKLAERRIKFDDDAKQKFLDMYRQTNLMMFSAEAACVTFQTVCNHIENDPDFADAVEEAKQAYHDRVIEHHQKLVFEGITNPVFAGKDGDHVGDKTEYPIQLIAMEVKKVDPSYKERSEVDVKGGGGVVVVPADMDPDAWVAEQMEKNKTRVKPGSQDDNGTQAKS